MWIGKLNELTVQQLLSKTAAPTAKFKAKPTLSTDKQVCRFFLEPEGCENGDERQYAHPRTNGKCLRCGSETHSRQDCTRPRLQQASPSGKPKPARKNEYSKAKGRTAEAQTSKPQALSGELVCKHICRNRMQKYLLDNKRLIKVHHLQEEEVRLVQEIHKDREIPK